jgi:phytoene dehydrogenase-like protein
MVTNNYDLVVIGSGPAGQKSAIAAAKLGKRVAIVDREEMIGGVCLQIRYDTQQGGARSHSLSDGFSPAGVLRSGLFG